MQRGIELFLFRTFCLFTVCSYLNCRSERRLRKGLTFYSSSEKMLTVVSTTHYDTNRCEAQCLCCGKKCAFPYTTATFVCVECVDKKTRVVTVDLLGQQTIQFVVSPIESAESALICLSKKFSAAIKDASQFALQGFDSLNWRIVQRDQGESPQEVQRPQEVQEVDVFEMLQSPFVDRPAEQDVLNWHKNNTVAKDIDVRLLPNALARRKAWFLNETSYNKACAADHESKFNMLCVTKVHPDEQCASTLDYLIRHTRFIRRLTKHLREYNPDAVVQYVTHHVKLPFLNLNATFEDLDDTNVDLFILNDMLKERADQQMFHNNKLVWEDIDTIIKLRFLACTRLLPSEMIAARLCGKSTDQIGTVALLRVVSRSNYNTVADTPAGFKKACDNFYYHYTNGSFEDACASRITRLLLEKLECDPMWYVGASESWQFVKCYAEFILQKFSGLIDKISKYDQYKLLKAICGAKTASAVDFCFENFNAPEPAPTPRKAPKAKSKKTKRDRSASPPPKKDKNKRSASPAPKRVPQEKVEPVTDPVLLRAGIQEQICATVQAINVLEDELRMFGGKFAKHSHDEPVNDVYRDQYELNDPEVRAQQILEQEKAQKARDLAVVHPEIIDVMRNLEQKRLREEAEKQEQERLRKEAEERKRKEAEEQERLRKEAEEQERQKHKEVIERRIAALIQESERLEKARAQCGVRSGLGKVIETLNGQMLDCELAIGRNRKLIDARRRLLDNMDADDVDMKEDFDKYTAGLVKFISEGDRLAAEFNALQNMREKAENDLKDATVNDDIFPVMTLEDLERQEEAVKKELQELNEQLRQFN